MPTTTAACESLAKDITVLQASMPPGLLLPWLRGVITSQATGGEERN